jgi:predicted amidohydrolase
VERAIWADGDASRLIVHQRHYGRLSSLNCWEHNSVLPGYALMTQGPQIHFRAMAWSRVDAGATRADGAVLAPAAAVARVLASGQLRGLRGRPAQQGRRAEEFRHLQTLDTTGDSAFIDARGEVLTGPVSGETILVGECDRR